MSTEDYRKTYRNNLEVIIEHYRDLETEIRQIRQSYEVELQRINCEDAIKGLDSID